MFSFRGAALALVTLPLLACSPSEVVENRVSYNCGALPLTTTLNDDTLTLSFGTDATETLQLTAVTSASGARYTDVTSGAEFWSKENEAQFSSDAFSLPLCVVQGTLPQQFNARGNEPFWLLAVDGAQATLRQPGSEQNFAVSRPAAEQVQPLKARIELDNGGYLTLEERICYDSMSGQNFPYEATLYTGSDTLSGCAGDPNRLIAGASWQVVGAPADLAETPSLTFHSDQRVSGFAGCNYLNGRYEITGEGLRFAPIAVTKRMCGPEAMDFEDSFLRQLQQTTNVKVFSDGTLQLTASNGDYLQLQQVALKLWRDD